MFAPKKPTPVTIMPDPAIKKLIEDVLTIYLASIVGPIMIGLSIIVISAFLALLLFTLAFIATQEHIYMFGIILTVSIACIPAMVLWSCRDKNDKLELKFR